MDKFFITNRTFSKAEGIASKLGGEAVPFEMIGKILPSVDIVISATGSSEYIVDYKMMKQCMHTRDNKPVFIIDIAVPRDFSPKIRDIENVFLHDIDDLNVIVDKNITKRKAEIPKAEKIIKEEVKNFTDWYKSLEVTPIIKMLREKFEIIRKSEFEQHKKKFSKEDWEQLDLFTKHIIKRLLHCPISKMKTFNEDPYISLQMIDAINELFELHKKKKGE